MKYTNIFTFLAILFFCTACNGRIKKDIPKEKLIESDTVPVEHPKLIKNIGSPKYGNVQCSLQDKAGNLWFGTTENGLYKYDGKSFRQFLVADGLISNNIWCILEDKEGKIWIGTEEGVCLYDNKTFAAIKIPLSKNLPPNKNRNTHEVFSIMQDKSGKLWFATIDGVYIYGARLNGKVGQGKSFTPFIVNEGAGGYMSSNNNAEKILEDKAGNIWFGGRGNEAVYCYDGRSVTNIKLKELFQDGPKPKAHNWGWPQLQDKNGNIWFSNWGGAYRYDGKSFTSFTASDGLAIGPIMRIIEDRNGNIWFGGAGGLCRYDGKSFTCFKDGLINPGIWSILEDTNGNLWVGTRATGLYLFDGRKFIGYSEYKH
ncbi:MAG: two-component regulator propeller domain-containing protein [Ferruginibacter sp.]